jgi:hypothetical protein
VAIDRNSGSDRERRMLLTFMMDPIAQSPHRWNRPRGKR